MPVQEEEDITQAKVGTVIGAKVSYINIPYCEIFDVCIFNNFLMLLSYSYTFAYYLIGSYNSRNYETN
jgi:hypothetical protein